MRLKHMCTVVDTTRLFGFCCIIYKAEYSPIEMIFI